MNYVPFKVYYRDEIRRFSLVASYGDSNPSYASLVQRIQTIFDIDKTAQLRLSWLDAEGDRVAFSSDPELADAVLHLTQRADRPYGACVRVYAVAKSSDADEFDAASSIAHPGVYCDGCNASIRGYRFKCTACPDYDLCLACLRRDVHSQHPMALIRRPGDAWVGGGGGGWGPMARRCFLRGQQQEVLNAQASGASFQQHRCCRRGVKAGAMMREAQTGASGPVTATSGASTAAMATSTTACADVRTGEKLAVEHVTSAISAVLQPLGIDASIQVVRQEADAGVQSQPPRSRDASSEASVVKASLLTEAAATARVPTAESQASTEDNSTESCVQFQGQSLGSSAASFVDPSSAPATPSTDRAGTPPAGDFEFVASSGAAATAGHEAKIARALEHMAAMGFNDEGGWLTRLLVAKDGDICAVLDAIRPIGGGK